MAFSKEAPKIVIDEPVRVRFDTNVQTDLAWNFKASKSLYDIKPGKVYKVEFEVENELSMSLLCRKSQMVQLLTILVNNSIDAMGQADNKWIKIKVLPGVKGLVLSVTDAGQGLQADVAERLFVPFSRDL